MWTVLYCSDISYFILLCLIPVHTRRVEGCISAMDSLIHCHDSPLPERLDLKAVVGKLLQRFGVD